MAYPALLGMRKRYPGTNFVIVTTQNVGDFANTIGVFDELVMINESGFFRLAVSSIRAWIKCIGADIIFDLEVYSRMTTLFSAICLARNRIGFYMDDVFWRKNLHTHLVYFNRYSAVYLFYDKMARLIDAPPVSTEECRSHLIRNLKLVPKEENSFRLGIAVGCSVNTHI